MQESKRATLRAIVDKWFASGEEKIELTRHPWQFTPYDIVDTFDNMGAQRQDPFFNSNGWELDHWMNFTYCGEKIAVWG